ncbi:MAG: CBS domain-containing protein [Flavobacteriaceae bacterium]|nr:CBS domain-containing protein [Flavobacteriaceae bacterium]
MQEYLINDIVPLEITENICQAQDYFSQLTYSHIPVVEQQQYIGCLPETDAHCFEGGKSIKEIRHILLHFFATPDMHWLDIVGIFAKNETNILPVVDKDKKYLGYFEITDFMHHFHNTPFLSEPGVVIEVQKKLKDYSFSEVTQIVETNDVKFFGAFISEIIEDKVSITLKISGGKLDSVLQTFRRYGYEILGSSESDEYREILKERSAYLSKYLDI